MESKKLKPAKQALADAIHQNGGWPIEVHWRFSTSSRVGAISFWVCRPKFNSTDWFEGVARCVTVMLNRGLPNWHQCILSREEYYHAYPMTDDDGWIEWKGGECPVDGDSIVDVEFNAGHTVSGAAKGLSWHHEWKYSNIIKYRLHKPEVKPEFCESVTHGIPEPESIDGLCAKVTEENKHQHVDAKPTIEQLAQDYRNAKDYAVRLQKEADDAARSADAKLRELERAGESIGLIIGIAKQESAPVIIDWRDLKVGDEIRCIGDWQDELTDGLVLKVDDVETPDYRGDLAVRVLLDDREGAWGKDFEFISRP